MAVGMPGTGVGGLFYLISGLLMPIREMGRWVRGERDRASARLVARQTAIVAGVLAGLWATGWLLGHAIAQSPAAAAMLQAADGRGPAANILGAATVLAAFLTLGTVVGSVELLRIVVGRRDVRTPVRRRVRRGRPASRPARMRARAIRNVMVAALLSSWPSAAATQQQLHESRAVFLQAQQSGSPAEGLELYRRYVELEPADPWGYMAVGDALGQLGRWRDGLAWYERAAGLAPGERDVAMGRAKLLARAGRSRAAAREYARWLAGHPDDAEATRLLGRERLKSAPVVEPVVGASRDSDGNATTLLGFQAGLLAADGARLGASVRRTSLRDGLNTGAAEEVWLTAAWHPRAEWNLDAALGVQRLASSAIARELGTAPVGQLRARWRAPAGGPRLDLRAQRGVLALSPDLIANTVTRSELSARLDLPAGPVRLRGMGRAAGLSARLEENSRTVVGGGLALPVTAAVEVSGLYHRLQYAEPSSAGYFAPRLAQVVEAASYMELEAGNVLFSLDLGAGVQRVAEHRSGVGQTQFTVGPWRGSFRWYSLLELGLQPGRALKLEVEAYDTQLATQAAPTAAGWRYGSLSLSLRWAL